MDALRLCWFEFGVWYEAPCVGSTAATGLCLSVMLVWKAKYVVCPPLVEYGFSLAGNVSGYICGNVDSVLDFGEQCQW